MEEETQDDLNKTDTDKQDEEDPKSTDQTESELTSDLVLPVESKTEPEDFTSEISLGMESLPSTSAASTDLLSVPEVRGQRSEVTDLLSVPEVSKTKIYLKPPVSPELMIAIAVRNLDPQKVVGASCSDIVAFLSLHFPYFTDNYQECKVSHHIRSRVMT